MRSSSLAAGAAVFAAAVLGTVPAYAATTTVHETTGTPMCATSQLSASVSASHPAAGNLYRTLTLTNTSSTACHLTGFPGVSMLNASGQQIGQPATRESVAYAPVVLNPGGTASDIIHTTNHMGSCQPTSAKLKVYPPGNTASLVIAADVTNCGDVFQITPMVAGKQGTPSAPPSSGSSGGQQVPTVPSGAPDTGLASTGSHGGNTAALTATGAGALLLAGAGVAVARRRRVRAER